MGRKEIKHCPYDTPVVGIFLEIFCSSILIFAGTGMFFQHEEESKVHIVSLTKETHQDKPETPKNVFFQVPLKP